MQKNWHSYLNKVRRGVRELHQFLQPLIEIYLKLFFIVFNLFIFVYLFLPILIIIKEAISSTMDVENMASIAERGTIVSATLAVLTFTYASCFENSAKKHIINIGEYFLKSTLFFLVGIIFLTGFGESIVKRTGVVNDSVLIYFSFIVLMLFTSIYFFVRGISDLLKQLFWKEHNIEELKERI